MTIKTKEGIVPSGRVHVGFAFLLWILIQTGVEQTHAYFINPVPFLIGSLFPDCDHRKAPMGKILPLWLFFKHRGFTHSLVSLVVFTSPLVIWGKYEWAITFALGYLLHLAMDDSTPMRVRWLVGHR